MISVPRAKSLASDRPHNSKRIAMTDELIGVTAATGHLGRLVVSSLLEKGVPADRIVATTRDTERAADLGAIAGE